MFGRDSGERGRGVGEEWEGNGWIGHTIEDGAASKVIVKEGA
jgi:hypothetical protein